MSEFLEIVFRRRSADGKWGPSIWLKVPRVFDLEGNQLDIAMTVANRHFGNPDKHIGGPILPRKESKK